MYAVGRLGSYISRGVYTVSGPFHPFGGAVDIIVVEQPDGSFRSSPWYVRFGKFQGVLKAKEKVVKINVNGVDAGFHMYLDHKGEAYFLKEIDEDEEFVEPNLYPSSSSDGEASDGQSKSVAKCQRPIKCQSYNLDDTVSGQMDSVQGKIVAQTSARRSRILGFVFGRRSMKEESFRAEEVLDQGLGRTDSLERAEVAADLLELKWSEGLTTKKYRKDGTSRFSTHDDSKMEYVDNRVYDEGSSRDSRNVKENIEMVTYYDRHIDSAGGEANKDISNVVPEMTADCLSKLNVITGEDRTVLPECEAYEESCTERIRSSDHGELPESLHLGFSGLAEEYQETLYLNADGQAGEACLETTLVEGEVASKDPLVIDMKTTYEDSQEVILLNSLEDEANESRDGWITGDKSRGVHQPDLESVGKLESSFINNSFSRPASSSSSDRSEEVQFHFTDLDDLETSKPSRVHRYSSDLINDEEMSACLEKFDHELSTDNSKVDGDKAISTPINIVKLSLGVDDDVEVGQLVKSMPPMRSQIENIDPYLIQAPLSQSLDIDIKHLGLSSPSEEYESPLKPKEDLDEDRFHESRDEQISEEVGNIPLSSEVELSLCRQMLYEGMGAEAALQAFESAKLDRDKFLSLCPVIMEDDRLVVRFRGHYFPWEAAAPLVLGIVSFGSELLKEPKGMINVEKKDEGMLDDDMSRVMIPSSGGWRLWPFSRRYRSGKVMQDTGMPSADIKEKENSSDLFGSPNKSFMKPKSGKKMVRSIIPTSEQLASLNLKEGSNSVTFTFSTAMLGDQPVDARIYLWKWNTRIIISDVDGTITKSDVLGQFMPLVGMDWSQTGVAHLFTAIKENGYQLLFLSARAISQAYNTRRFLFSLKQDGKCMPDGPVVISPDGLFPSLFREVIRRAPHEFKIACLEDIKALFPPDSNPFYAGFGNRITDEISYLKVGIPKGKIFTINPKGEVVVNKHINTKSYTSLHELVHGMFPPTAKSEQEDFNSWNYWKLPPPDIDI